MNCFCIVSNAPAGREGIDKHHAFICGAANIGRKVAVHFHAKTSWFKPCLQTSNAQMQAETVGGFAPPRSASLATVWQSPTTLSKRENSQSGHNS
mmetsp:Transcript_6386/g.10821  ORF Transcript_6386/g.10821 Transcript_6386/m.10821 type:complete len:95 (-) Transcript_6386:33-317(-)